MLMTPVAQYRSDVAYANVVLVGDANLNRGSFVA
jgi:hypothetical protein